MPKRTAIVTALILERPLCLDCIADKGSISRTEVTATLANIERVLTVHRAEQQRCHACGSVGRVVFVDRPAG